MNNPFFTSRHKQSKSISPYTILQPIGAVSIPFGPGSKLSSSWRKFIHKSTQPRGTDAAATVAYVPTVSATTEGPIVTKSASMPDDYDARIEAFWHFVDSLESEAEIVEDVTPE